MFRSSQSDEGTKVGFLLFLGGDPVGTGRQRERRREAGNEAEVLMVFCA